MIVLAVGRQSIPFAGELEALLYEFGTRPRTNKALTETAVIQTVSLLLVATQHAHGFKHPIATHRIMLFQPFWKKYGKFMWQSE